MKYPASKHYSHLDLSEPIPKIELRYDEFKRELMSSFRRWAVLSLLAMAVIVMIVVTTTLPYMLDGVLFVCSFLVILLPQLVAAIRFRIKGKHKFRIENRQDPWGIPVYQQVLFQFYYFGLMVLIMQLPYFAGSLFSVSPMWGFYMLIGGLWLAIATRFMRQPGQISCGYCSYPIVGITLPNMCPECGRALLDLSYATDRPRVRDSRYVYGGVLIAASGVLFAYVSFKHQSAMYSVLPRQALMVLAPNDPDAFGALVRKQLTPEEKDELEGRLVNAIVTDDDVGFWAHAQGAWLSTRALNGALSETQLDGLLESAGEIWIDGTNRVLINTPVNLKLKASNFHTLDGQFSPDYYFSGYLLSDTGEAHMQHAEPRDHRELEHYVLSYGYQKESDGPELEFVPDEPGTITVRARVVLVMYASGVGDDAKEITWHEDGTHTFVNPPMWERVIELEHVVEVVE